MIFEERAIAGKAWQNQHNGSASCHALRQLDLCKPLVNRTSAQRLPFAEPHAEMWSEAAGGCVQVVRSRLQQRMARRAIRYRSGWDVLRITLRREGVGGLYKGLLPNVLRVMPQVSIPVAVVL